MSEQKFYDPAKPFGEQIRKIVEQTHPKDNREISVRRIGKRYEVITRWTNLPEMTVTDGTGTKGDVIWRRRTFHLAGHNPFAMTVDDLYEHNYEPYKLQSHLILQEEDNDAILQSITSLKNLCLQYKFTLPISATKLPIIIDGGETVILNTIRGMEFAVTATGYAEPSDVLHPHAEQGDALIGMASNGLHSNGYTFAIDGILGKLQMKLDDKFDFGPTVGEELERPTSIYLEASRIEQRIERICNWQGAYYRRCAF